MNAVIAIVSVTAAVAAALLWLLSPSEAARALREGKAARVVDLVDGEMVRVTGAISAQTLLTAPLSGRSCAAYDLRLEELDLMYRPARWREILRVQRLGEIEVEDSTGRAIVEHAGVELAIALDHHAVSGETVPSPELEELLAKHGLESVGSFGINSDLRYREGVLEPGATVAVVGRARRVPPGSATYRQVGRAELVMIVAVAVTA